MAFTFFKPDPYARFPLHPGMQELLLKRLGQKERTPRKLLQLTRHNIFCYT